MPHYIGEAVALRIATICDEQNISINKLSKRAGLTQSTVASIMSGQTQNARIITIKKICDASNVSLKEFFDHPLFFDCEYTEKKHKKR